MNGRQLYEAYAELQEGLNNCTVDAWDDLEEIEQNVWNQLARRF